MRRRDLAPILALTLLGGCQVPVMGALDPMVAYAIQTDQEDLADQAVAWGNSLDQALRQDPAFARIRGVTTVDRDLARDTRPTCYVVVAGTLGSKDDLPRLKELATATLSDSCRVVLNATQVATPGQKRYRSP